MVSLADVALALPPTKGIVRLSMLLQPLKAAEPILVTLSGITTLVKEVQFLNAPEPMLVTLSGITTLVKEPHPLNVSSFILVPPLMTIVCKFVLEYRL